MSLDYAVHSNLLIHWTGNDIDERYDPNWHMMEKSATPCQELEDEYLARLLNILRYGLWMTPEPELPIKICNKQYAFPEVPRVCFTELRLSHSRTHAKRYGRLGIGVKRPFVFERGGRPVTYYGRSKHQEKDLFMQSCAESMVNKNLLHYFKAMNSADDQPNYDFYAESEWRIIYDHEQKNRKKVVDHRQNSNFQLDNYLKSLPHTTNDKLRYLIPLDGWLSCIIYPSVSLKNRAKRDKHIIDEIERIKGDDHGNLVEEGNWPVEMDIDLCRNL